MRGCGREGEINYGVESRGCECGPYTQRTDGVTDCARGWVTPESPRCGVARSAPRGRTCPSDGGMQARRRNDARGRGVGEFGSGGKRCCARSSTEGIQGGPTFASWRGAVLHAGFPSAESKSGFVAQARGASPSLGRSRTVEVWH